jgi:hypothetical protein
LVVERGAFGDGAEWSFQVRPARLGERGDVPALTIPEVMSLGGIDHIDLLKVDIEGAEEEVFGPLATLWLSRVRHLAIEIHGSECARKVAGALAHFRFDPGRSGELTLFQNLCLLPSVPGAAPRCS